MYTIHTTHPSAQAGLSTEGRKQKGRTLGRHFQCGRLLKTRQYLHTRVIRQSSSALLTLAGKWRKGGSISLDTEQELVSSWRRLLTFAQQLCLKSTSSNQQKALRSQHGSCGCQPVSGQQKTGCPSKEWQTPLYLCTLLAIHTRKPYWWGSRERFHTIF